MIAMLLTIGDKRLFFIVYNLTIAYLLIYLAYVPGRFYPKIQPAGRLFIWSLYICIPSPAIRSGIDSRNIDSACDIDLLLP